MRVISQRISKLIDELKDGMVLVYFNWLMERSSLDRSGMTLFMVMVLFQGLMELL